MFAFNITDRRLNPSGKNLSNRQRFLERVKKKIANSVTRGIQQRSIGDSGDAEVSISSDGIEEPTFIYDTEHGIWEHLLPGNKEYGVGDLIPRPPSDSGGGGSKGSPDGDGEDDFRFYISYEEYISAILDDLALPDMTKASEKHTISYELRRAGYTPAGAACNLALERTMIQGLSRRIALKSPKLLRIMELESELDMEEDVVRRLLIEEEIADLRQRATAIPWLDKNDLRYHNTIRLPQPITQAVMVCAMDVSGSMTEHMKDLAKRFYILLYVFLRRMYKDVDVVFIRHTHEAKEVDEETFFRSPESGGTVVSTAYEVMHNIIQERYPIDQWNIYCAQASDGDNTSSDNDIAEQKLTMMLPWIQYMTYIEVGRDNNVSPGFVRRDSDLWQVLQEVSKTHPGKLAMRKIDDKNEIIEVFRSFFNQHQSKTLDKAA